MLSTDWRWMKRSWGNAALLLFLYFSLYISTFHATDLHVDWVSIISFPPAWFLVIFSTQRCIIIGMMQYIEKYPYRGNFFYFLMIDKTQNFSRIACICSIYKDLKNLWNILICKVIERFSGSFDGISRNKAHKITFYLLLELSYGSLFNFTFNLAMLIM